MMTITRRNLLQSATALGVAGSLPSVATAAPKHCPDPHLREAAQRMLHASRCVGSYRGKVAKWLIVVDVPIGRDFCYGNLREPVFEVYEMMLRLGGGSRWKGGCSMTVERERVLIQQDYEPDAYQIDALETAAAKYFSDAQKLTETYAGTVHVGGRVTVEAL